MSVPSRDGIRFAQKIISALPVPGFGQRQSRFDIGDGILCLMGISNIMRLAPAVDSLVRVGVCLAILFSACDFLDPSTFVTRLLLLSRSPSSFTRRVPPIAD